MKATAYDGLVSALVEHDRRSVSCVGTDTFFCPVHADGEIPNLHLTYDGGRGCVLAHCFSCGANGAAVVDVLELPRLALWDSFWAGRDVRVPERRGDAPQRRTAPQRRHGGGLTVDVLALAWKIRADDLRRYVRDGHAYGVDAVVFPHFDPEQERWVFRQRLSLEGSVENPPGERGGIFNWLVLEEAREQGRIAVVESEHDAITLSVAGLPAIATAGANGWARVAAFVSQAVDGLDVFVFPHRDAAGEKFARDVAEVIPRARFVRLPDELGKGGDVSDLYLRDPEGFPADLEHRLRYSRRARTNGHGSEAAYRAGCRCEPCTAAHATRIRRERHADIKAGGAALIERARCGPDTDTSSFHYLFNATVEDVLRVIPESAWCSLTRPVGLVARDGREARVSVFRCMGARCPHCVGDWLERVLGAVANTWEEGTPIYRSVFTPDEWADRRRKGRAQQLRTSCKGQYLRVLQADGTFVVFAPEGDELLDDPGAAIAAALLHAPAWAEGRKRTYGIRVSPRSKGRYTGAALLREDRAEFIREIEERTGRTATRSTPDTRWRVEADSTVVPLETHEERLSALEILHEYRERAAERRRLQTARRAADREWQGERSPVAALTR